RLLRGPQGRIPTCGAPGTFPSPVGINYLGQVAGHYEAGSSPTFYSRGFVRDAQGNITPFDVPGLPSSGPNPVGINDLGQVAISFPAGSQAFVRDAQGTITTFDVPGAVSQYPQGINNLGQIVG